MVQPGAKLRSGGHTVAVELSDMVVTVQPASVLDIRASELLSKNLLISLLQYSPVTVAWVQLGAGPMLDLLVPWSHQYFSHSPTQV